MFGAIRELFGLTAKGTGIFSGYSAKEAEIRTARFEAIQKIAKMAPISALAYQKSIEIRDTKKDDAAGYDSAEILFFEAMRRLERDCLEHIEDPLNPAKRRQFYDTANTLRYKSHIIGEYHAQAFPKPETGPSGRSPTLHLVK